jgi:MFS family permease
VLAVFRFAASLGIGGEWAAGASLVNETMPPSKRVAGGALLYTSAPAGLLLATYVNDLFTRKLDVIASDPTTSWRAVFLTGLVPVIVALLIRLKVKEPDPWAPAQQAPTIRELFSPELRRHTLGGLAMALVALISWWSCERVHPGGHRYAAVEMHPPADLLPKLRVQFQTTAPPGSRSAWLFGTLFTVPVATRFGRRPMFFWY